MMLHKRYNSETMSIVFGTTSIKGDSSTQFSCANTSLTIKHWHLVAHYPQRLQALHELSRQPSVQCPVCNSEATAFTEKVIKALPQSSI